MSPSDSRRVSASMCLLGTRIDGLTVSAAGIVDPDLFERVAAAHVAAHEEHKTTSRRTPHQVKVGGETYEVLANGRRTTPYLLRCLSDSGTEIGLGPRRPGGEQNVRLRLGAFTLDGLGTKTAAERILKTLEAICRYLEPTHVTALDLAADWQGWVPTWDPMAYVRRGMHSALWQDPGGRVTGMGFGYEPPAARGGPPRPKAPFALRLDVKSQEVRDHSGKLWLTERWAQCAGYRANRPVYRAEVRFSREFLMHRAGLRHAGIAETLEAAARLWLTALSKQIRCTAPTSSGQRCRWETIPEWTTLAEAFGRVELLGRAPAVRSPLDPVKVEVRAVRATQSLMAIREKVDEGAADAATVLARIGARVSEDLPGLERARREVEQRSVLHSGGGYHSDKGDGA